MKTKQTKKQQYIKNKKLCFQEKQQQRRIWQCGKICRVEKKKLPNSQSSLTIEVNTNSTIELLPMQNESEN